MFKASDGGGVASQKQYRHALVRLVIPLLAPLGTGTGWSPLALALGAVLMSWDAAPTLMQRFESALALLDAALPWRRRTGRTYQGFVKALKRCGGQTLGTLCIHLRVLTRRAAQAGKCWTIGEFVPFGADGSKFDAPRTVSNEALGLAGKDKCGPQMMMLLLVHLGSMLPWAWKAAGARDSERSLLRTLLDTLPENALLVADAGFTGFDLLSELYRNGIHFLIRVGSGVKLLKELGHYQREGQSTVYLWPDAKHAAAPLTLRLIRVGSVYLITDVTDPKRLSRKTAGELYRRRWGLEVAFRSLKQTLERRKVRSAAAANARAELDWSVAGLWVLSLLGVRAIVGARRQARQLSLAKVLSAVRAARLGPITDHALGRRLRAAVLDQYQRRGSKTAYRWPHKKNTKPPGAPIITKATLAQVQHATLLHPRKAAA